MLPSMMMRLALTPVLFVLILLALPARADDVAARLQSGPEAVVSAVVDGDTVILDRSVEGSDTVRLVGLQAPKLPLGRPDFKAWPLGSESKAALESLVLDRTVTLAFGGARLDRHGRHLAHLFRDDGLWVQGEMLKRGMARVYTFPDNRAVVGDMLAAERAARTATRGIWGLGFYALRDAVDTSRLLREAGTFQVIEGTVVAAARVKGRVYLNFAEDWRSDTTVSIGKREMKAFTRAGFDPLALQGKRIRARGWLRKRNGPLIEATHPEQIEILARR